MISNQELFVEHKFLFQENDRLFIIRTIHQVSRNKIDIVTKLYEIYIILNNFGA